MPKRPSLESIPQSTSSQILRHYPQVAVHRLFPLFARISFFVLPAKVEDDLDKIHGIITELGGSNVNVEQARVVLTALKGRPRLLKALGGKITEWQPVLTVDYVYDTFQICLDAANEGAKYPPALPDRKRYALPLGASIPGAVEPPSKRRRVDDGKQPGDMPDMELLPEDVDLTTLPRWCVQRPCPLICVNQDVVDAIKPIYLDREFEESQQKNSNILSYRRSMSILKSVPRKIRSGKEARLLADVGEKVAMRIDEFLETGQVAESQEILASPRYQALQEFASVYTIGHHTSKELYDTHHCRTLGDVRRHYEAIAEESEEVRQKVKERRRRRGGMTHVDIVEAWMELKPELDTKISRAEVQEIADCVMEHLEAILPGCRYTICGGFRRGKPESSDVDIIICPPDEDQDIGLLQDLYLRLSSLDLITHVLYAIYRGPNEPIRAASNNFDNLDKVFAIFRLPGEGRLHRRLDIIMAPKERYAAAVLSWSGSMIFERDFKRYTETRGLKFKAAILEPTTGKEIFFETEREIFRYLGLRYVPPELRNADS